MAGDTIRWQLFADPQPVPRDTITAPSLASMHLSRRRWSANHNLSGHHKQQDERDYGTFRSCEPSSFSKVLNKELRFQ